MTSDLVIPVDTSFNFLALVPHPEIKAEDKKIVVSFLNMINPLFQILESNEKAKPTAEGGSA